MFYFGDSDQYHNFKYRFVRPEDEYNNDKVYIQFLKESMYGYLYLQNRSFETPTEYESNPPADIYLRAWINREVDNYYSWRPWVESEPEFNPDYDEIYGIQTYIGHTLDIHLQI